MRKACRNVRKPSRDREGAIPRVSLISAFGVATLAERESGEELIARTDAVLSKAKNSGRNRVEADGVGILQS